MSRVHHLYRRNRLQRRKLVLESLERRQVLTAYFVDGDVLSSGDGTERAPFATIREGIQAAMVAPGDDEVVIAPKASGPYIEPIALVQGNSPDQVQGFDQFNGNLVIRGSTGIAADIVLQSYYGSGIYIDVPIEVTIQGLTVASSGIHGIVNRSDSDVLLDNLIVRDHLHQGTSGAYGWSGIIHQGKHLTVRNSQLINNWQGIWAGFDDSVEPATAPGSLTVENTVSRNNYYSGIYAGGLTDGLTTVNFSGIDNGSMGLATSQISTVSISGGSFSNNRFKGINLNGNYGATIDGVLVDNNGSIDVEIGSGGAGIRVSPASSDPIVISNSIITNNETNRWGGGFEIYNTTTLAPTITFSNSEISRNRVPSTGQLTGRGGGISVYGPAKLEILDSKVLNNEAGTGGGIYHHAGNSGGISELKIDGSTLDGNSAYRHGGLDREFGGATTISNSTFSNNRGSTGAGGLRSISTTARLTNVTVSGNTSVQSAGGADIQARYSLLLAHSTIVNNTGGSVGGLVTPAQTAQLVNNVIASNQVTNSPAATTDVSGFVISGGGNLVGNSTGAQGFDPSRDFLGDSANPLNPVLDELQDNGGRTRTHKPLGSSPLIDVAVTPVTFGLPATDQRGVSRPQGAGPDIGAVEVEMHAPILEAASLNISIDEGNVATNNGSFSDIDGDYVELSASVGSVTVGSDGTWQWSLSSDDGPNQSTTVMVTAEDEYGLASTVQFELTVANVAPTLQLDATSPIYSGQAARLTLGASDPSQSDTDAEFSYRIDWNSDGTVDEVVSGNAVSASHVFTALGAHTITAVAVDKDGGVSQPVTAQVTVEPAPLGIIAANSVNLSYVEGSKKTYQVTIPSTPTLNARDIIVGSVEWLGASVSKASYKDVDRDGDIDAVFQFLLTDSDALALYRQAMTADSSNSHKIIQTELTGTTSSGIHYLAAKDVDFYMTGKALKELLSSI